MWQRPLALGPRHGRDGTIWYWPRDGGSAAEALDMYQACIHAYCHARLSQAKMELGANQMQHMCNQIPDHVAHYEQDRPGHQLTPVPGLALAWFELFAQDF